MKQLSTLLLLICTLLVNAQTYSFEQLTSIEEQNYEDPTGLVTFKGNLYFAATKSAGGKAIIELAKLTPDNTLSIVTQLYSTDYGSISNFEFAITVSGDRLFITKYDADGKGLCHSTDGSDFKKIMDPYAGLKGKNIDNLYATDDYLYYTAQTEDNGMELFSCESSSPKVSCLHILPGSLPAKVGKPYMYNGKLYFNATDASHGAELWSYTKGDGASIVSDHVLGDGDFDPKDFIVYNNKLFFTAKTAATGSELFSYDGNSIKLEQNIKDGDSDSEPLNKIVANNRLYFSAINNGGSNQLHYLFEDKVTEIDFPGPGSSKPKQMVEFDNLLFGQAFMSSTGIEVFYIKEEIPFMIDVDPRPSFLGSKNSEPEYLTVLNNTLYFIASKDGDRNIFKITKDSPTPVSKTYAKASVVIYPNPVENNINYTLENAEGTITIYNMSGMVVKHHVVTNAQDQIPFTNQKTGVYMLEYKGKGESKVIKFMKK